MRLKFIYMYIQFLNDNIYELSNSKYTYICILYIYKNIYKLWQLSSNLFEICNKLKVHVIFQALKYEEDYSNALKCFKRAQELDPTWEAPKNLEKILSKFLTDVKVNVKSFKMHFVHIHILCTVGKNWEIFAI